MYIYIYIYIYILGYTYMYTYIHTHTHMWNCLFKVRREEARLITVGVFPEYPLRNLNMQLYNVIYIYIYIYIYYYYYYYYKSPVAMHRDKTISQK